MTDNEAVKAYKQLIEYCNKQEITCDGCVFNGKDGYCLIRDRPFVDERRKELADLIKGVEENERRI